MKDIAKHHSQQKLINVGNWLYRSHLTDGYYGIFERDGRQVKRRLKTTDANSPSVVQIRTQDPTPSLCAELLLDILRRYAQELSAGALISVDEDRARVRLLPLNRDGI